MKTTVIKNKKIKRQRPLFFAHIGDLHINTAKDQNYIDLLSILSQLTLQCAEQLDFVYIPGDIADHGLTVQYQLVATALKMCAVPVEIIGGDHDMEQGNLSAFYHFLQQPQLPKAHTIKNCRCIFLDCCGPGKGGPDFRLGKEQVTWLENEMAKSQKRKETMLLFMHVYPNDLVNKTERVKLNKLIAEYDVALVDMGHTHYNELANDGQTIFAATRSTGQIEEGPVGYSLISIDNGIVSWRFKQLQDPFPFVMITSPADYRLVRNKDQIVEKSIEVSVIVCSVQGIKKVTCRADNHKKVSMQLNKETNTWHAIVNLPDAELVTILVEAVDQSGWPGQHSVRVASAAHKFIKRLQSGSDAASIGGWPENHIFGTQLGPNRNAKPD